MSGYQIVFVWYKITKSVGISRITFW